MLCTGACSHARSPPSFCTCKCNGAGHGSGAAFYKQDSKPRRIAQSHESVGVRGPAERVPFGEIERRKIIEAFNSKHKEIIAGIQPFGSMSRKTNIIETGDMDFLAIFNVKLISPNGKQIEPNYLLKMTKDILAHKYPKSSPKIDGQAVNMIINDSRVDIVPAIEDGYTLIGESTIYKIPRGDGTWLRTCPDGINIHLSEANKRSAGQLRTTIRSVKMFTDRTVNRVPLKSIYIELAVAQTKSTIGVKTKEAALKDAIVGLRDLNGREIKDPTGVGDPVQAANNKADLAEARFQLQRAANWATAAVKARERGDNKEAGRLWSLVFKREANADGRLRN